MKPQFFDFLVIGSGIAGLSYALKMVEYGSVAIITKKHSAESNTNYAQGGIAVVMDGVTDSFERHIEDTLICGASICDKEIVKIVVEEGPARVQELVALGAKFTKKGKKLDLGREGGHSANRIVHAADMTGREIERSLLQQVQENAGITMMEYHYCLDLLLTTEGECAGVWIVNEETGEVSAITANSTLLASGGSGQVYQHTSNPAIATGDGVAMAYRAGAKVANMEFFQFHPTCLYHPEASSFLITEAVRGAGGLLFNQAGERFMPAYHPSAELAPRDVVARAIDDQLKQRNEEYVLLDISHKPKKEVLAHFPMIHETCKGFGIDILKEPIPVVPAAHYQCGGVVADKSAKTSIPRLLACGEVAYTGLHGGNRLASNSLLEALVFSHRAVETSRKLKKKPLAKDAVFLISPYEEFTQPSKARRIAAGGAQRWGGKPPSIKKITTLHKKLRSLMWHQVGIVRSNARLAEALDALEALKQQITPLVQAHPTHIETNELRNLLEVAMLITRSALRRQESRGLHFLLDCPRPKAAYAKATIL